MAIELKRQTLLNNDKSKKNKKPAASNPDRNAANTAAPRASRSKAQPKKKSGVFKRLMLTFLVLVLVGLVIVPKPQLIVYKKLNLVARSVYLPGWFGTPGQFIDSSQRVIINKSLELVYLCYAEPQAKKQSEQQKEQCYRYQFIEQQGLIAAINHYVDNVGL